MTVRIATALALTVDPEIKNIINIKYNVRETIIGLLVRGSDEENMSEESPGFVHA
jgi:hypothetical protein